MIVFLALFAFGLGAEAADAASSSDGRFHVPPGPVRAAAVNALRARRAVTIPVARKLGVTPSTMSAVAVTISLDDAAGATQVWLGDGSRRPREPALVSDGRSASAFAIVPVSRTGELRIWNGAHRASVTVDVAGWFSSSRAKPIGTAGLFTRLAGRQVAKGAVGAGRSRTFVVRGKGDLAKRGVGSVLVRLRVSRAKAPGRLGIGATRRSASRTNSLTYGRGSTAGLAVARLKRGKLVIRNRGAKQAVVAVDAIGSFSDGSLSHAFGDTLHLVDPRSVVSGAAITREGRDVVTAGVGGVPAETTSEPPSLVLIRTLASAPSRSGSLLAYPEGSIAVAPALSWRRNTAAAGLVLAQPADSNQTTLATTAGAARVTGTGYAYFAGGTVVAEGLHRLGSDDAIAEVRPDAVVFVGQPASLADLVPGDLLLDDGTNTETGFLRRVASTEIVDGNLVVATTDAGIADAFEQAHISWGGTAVRTETPLPSGSLGRAARGSEVKMPGGSCKPGLWAVGISFSCKTNSGVVTLENEITAEFSASIDVGHFGAHVHTALTVSDTLTGTVSAGDDTDLNLSQKLAEYFLLCPSRAGRLLSNCSWEVPIGGPVPIFLTPTLSLGLKANGHVSGGFSASAWKASSKTVSYDSDTGASLTMGEGHGGDAHNSERSAQVDLKVSVVPAVNFYISFAPVIRTGEPIEPPALKAYASLSPYLKFTADNCSFRGYAGLDFTAGIALTAFTFKLVDASWTRNVAEAEIFARNWQNCAIWSGIVDFGAQLHYQGDNHTRDVNAKSKLRIPFRSVAPPASAWEGGHIYKAGGNGSGRQVEVGTARCYVDGNPFDYTITTLTTWGGEFRMGDHSGGSEAPEVEIRPMNYKRHGKDVWVLAFSNGGIGPYEPYLLVPGHETRSGLRSTYGCDALPDEETDYPGWWADVFGFYGGLNMVDRANAGQLFFSIAPGRTSTSGSHTIPAEGNQEGFSVSYGLKKTCSLGGTDC